MSRNYFISIFILLLTGASSLMIITSKGKENCLTKTIKRDDTLRFSYMISGQNEDSVYVTLKFSDNLIYSNQIAGGKYKSEENDFHLQIEQEGVYSLCFFANLELVVSFDFSTQYESGHITNIVQEDMFEGFNKNISMISYLFEDIEKNMKFYYERREIHSKIIGELHDMITSISLGKITIIVLFTILHGYLIKKLFENKYVNYTSSSIMGI